MIWHSACSEMCLWCSAVSIQSLKKIKWNHPAFQEEMSSTRSNNQDVLDAFGMGFMWLIQSQSCKMFWGKLERALQHKLLLLLPFSTGCVSSVYFLHMVPSIPLIVDCKYPCASRHVQSVRIRNTWLIRGETYCIAAAPIQKFRKYAEK